jgi:hypothetical protein
MRDTFKALIDIVHVLVREGFEKFGRYYSDYRGFVFDNEDPDGLARVQLVIPEITGPQPLNIWAWPKGVFSGVGYGSQVIPKKGEMVWVSFEKGNPRAPMYVLGHHGYSPDGKTPEKPERLKDIKNYWFMTPEGQGIELDDTKKEIILSIIGKFKLGDGEVTEPAVLGHELQTKLEALCDEISAACAKAQSMNTAVAIITVPTAVGPSGVPVNAASFTQLSADFAAIKVNVDQIKAEIEIILSETIFIK